MFLASEDQILTLYEQIGHKYLQIFGKYLPVFANISTFQPTLRNMSILAEMWKYWQILLIFAKLLNSCVI